MCHCGEPSNSFVFGVFYIVQWSCETFLFDLNESYDVFFHAFARKWCTRLTKRIGIILFSLCVHLGVPEI